MQLSNVDILFPMAIYLLPPQNPPSTYPEEALSIEEGEPQMFKRLFRPSWPIMDQKGGTLERKPPKTID